MILPGLAADGTLAVAVASCGISGASRLLQWLVLSNTDTRSLVQRVLADSVVPLHSHGYTYTYHNTLIPSSLQANTLLRM